MEPYLGLCNKKEAPTEQDCMILTVEPRVYNPIYRSLTAASIGKYDIPISYHTGVPIIGVAIL